MAGGHVEHYIVAVEPEVPTVIDPMDLLIHFMLGMGGACIGWWARGFCQHFSHRLVLTVSLVLVESVAAISIVG